MSKKLLSLFAAVGLLLTTSCSKDDTTTAVVGGDEVQVSFTIPAPDGAISTRATTIGDGSHVNNLYYSVYDADGTLLEVSGVKTSAFTTKTSDDKPCETVDIRLVKGQKYTVLFWAQSENTTAYEIAQVDGENDLTDITVKYNGYKANNELRDAFFGKEVITEVTRDKSYTVTLKRPFAQVNVGVDEDEWNAAVAAGVTVAKSAISFTDIPNNFNVETGQASGSVDVEYGLKDIIPGGILSVDTDDNPTTADETFKHLTLAYILAHVGSNTTDAVLTFEGTAGETISVDVDKMPFQRNYRTNIFGHVLTRSNDFKVIIDSKFDDDHNIKLNEEDVNGVAALNTAMGNNDSDEPIIYNIEGYAQGTAVAIPDTFVAEQVTFNFEDIANNKTLTIESPTYDGTIVINVPVGVTIGHLTINTPNAHVILNQGGYSTIDATTSSSTLVVGAGVTVEKVEVKAGNVKVMPESEVAEVAQHEDNDTPVIIYVEEGADVPATVGEDVKVYVENKDEAGDNVYVYTLTGDLNLDEIYTISEPVIFDGAGFTLTSSAGRAINIDTEGDVTIKNLTIVAENSERGINIINQAANVTLENVNVTAANYAVNVWAPGKAVNVNIKNSVLTALNVVNVNAADGATVTVEGTTLNCADESTEENYAALVLCKDAINSSIAADGCTFNILDDSVKANNESPNGTITIDGSTDDVVVMVAAIVFDGGYYYSFDKIQSAIDYAVKNNMSEIVALRQIVIDEDVTIDLQGKKIVATENFELFKVIEGGKLTISNGTAEAYASVIWNNGGEVVINGGTYNQTGSAAKNPSTYRYAIKTDATATTTVNDGTFTSNNGLFDVSGTIVIDGGSFDNEIKAVTTRHMMYVWGSGNVTINGGEFKSVANSSAGGECICIYTSNANVSITGGKFTSLWSSGSENGIISHYSSGSTVNVTGGTFNTKKGLTAAEGYGIAKVGNNYCVIEGYVAAETTAVVSNTDELKAALADVNINTIYMGAGKFVPSLYPGDIPTRESLTFIGTGDTQFAYTGSNYAGQFSLTGFDNITIRNCEILKRENVKEWGMIVFGSSDNANGVYSFENCTFKGVGTQGVYINENTSGATYNFTNCAFDGDFGGEGAITVQNNDGVEHIVNVKGCTFTNIPSTSHKIFVKYAYNGWTLNTDLDANDVYWNAGN